MEKDDEAGTTRAEQAWQGTSSDALSFPFSYKADWEAIDHANVENSADSASRVAVS